MADTDGFIDLMSKFNAIHREYSPKPRKFYAFCTSVTDTTTTAGIIASGAFHLRLCSLILSPTRWCTNGCTQSAIWSCARTSRNPSCCSVPTPQLHFIRPTISVHDATTIYHQAFFHPLISYLAFRSRHLYPLSLAIYPGLPRSLSRGTLARNNIGANTLSRSFHTYPFSPTPRLRPYTSLVFTGVAHHCTHRFACSSLEALWL